MSDWFHLVEEQTARISSESTGGKSKASMEGLMMPPLKDVFHIMCVGKLGLSKASQSQIVTSSPPARTAYRREIPAGSCIFVGVDRLGTCLWEERKHLGVCFLGDALIEMALTVRGVIRAEDVLRCLMFEDDPGRRSVGCRSEVGCGGTRGLNTRQRPLFGLQVGENSRNSSL
jgi:hypothetical protein